MSGEQQLKQMIHVDEAIFLLIIYKPFFLEVTVIFFFHISYILNTNVVILSVRHCTIALSNCSTAFFANSVSANDLSSQSVTMICTFIICAVTELTATACHISIHGSGGTFYL
jgi:hypothetical protein